MAKKSEGGSQMNPIKVADLRTAIAPGDFYRHELPRMPVPRSTHWCDGGLCPFHDDHKPGSFKVNLTTGSFRCFACDARGGDIVDFVRLREGIKFQDALRLIADQWGICHE